MRIRRDGGHISIRDRAALFWALGLFLLVGGLLAVAMLLGLVIDCQRPRAVGAPCQCCGGVGGSLWSLAVARAQPGDLCVVQSHALLPAAGCASGFDGRDAAVAFVQIDLESVEVDECTDSEGDTVRRLRLSACGPASWSRSSEPRSHDQAAVEESASVRGRATPSANMFVSSRLRRA